MDMLPPNAPPNAPPIPSGSGSTNPAPSSSNTPTPPIPPPSNSTSNSAPRTVLQKFISAYSQLSLDSQDYLMQNYNAQLHEHNPTAFANHLAEIKLEKLAEKTAPPMIAPLVAMNPMNVPPSIPSSNLPMTPMTPASPVPLETMSLTTYVSSVPAPVTNSLTAKLVLCSN
ncbi:hypothetical protein PAXRUDRAFT_14139 [Paxillus rubicundulus Ve08.2h10]|uniref:Uncharacterized protein n=1 Tax=Paxillus rubicundulus Ve08.2h10 TaxID=930991 RepID=A0A0D0DX18_9AGAM|nr:hypothetical protein PAXRUDRAFT_14139 [Paxillus rubicundulus Ve08.2h10]